MAGWLVGCLRVHYDDDRTCVEPSTYALFCGNAGRLLVLLFYDDDRKCVAPITFALFSGRTGWLQLFLYYDDDHTCRGDLDRIADRLIHYHEHLLDTQPTENDYKAFIKWLDREKKQGRSELYDYYHADAMKGKNWEKREMLHNWMNNWMNKKQES